MDIQLISNDTEIFAGTTAIFQCSATGIPDPTLSWIMNGEELNASERIKITMANETIDNVTFFKSYLEICDAELGDSGMYVCVAEVPGQFDTASFNLTVVTLPAMITIAPANVTIVNGTDVELECEGSGAPLPTVEWTRNGGSHGGVVNIAQVDAITVNSTLLLERVMVGADYTCSVSNDFGSDDATATITVQCMCTMSSYCVKEVGSFINLHPHSFTPSLLSSLTPSLTPSLTHVPAHSLSLSPNYTHTLLPSLLLLSTSSRRSSSRP